MIMKLKLNEEEKTELFNSAINGDSKWCAYTVNEEDTCTNWDWCDDRCTPLEYECQEAALISRAVAPRDCLWYRQITSYCTNECT